MGGTIRFLDEADVRAALKWPALIDAMEQALSDLSAGRAIQPVRNMLTIEEGRRYFGVMPAAAGPVMGLKAVSFYPANAGTNVPTHSAMILLFRADTGEPAAVLDGRLITEMRTAAVSAAVTRRLAPPVTPMLALVGSGVQAESHVAALREVLRFEEVRVWSPSEGNRRRFAEHHDARAVASAEEAVRGADVVVVATASQTPVVKGAWLKPGAHVNAVGAPRPTWRELDDAAAHAGPLIVDSRAAAVKESGDVILSKAPIYAEAGEIFAGAVAKPPAGATTIFKSLGLAIEDVVAAQLACAAG